MWWLAARASRAGGRRQGRRRRRARARRDRVRDLGRGQRVRRSTHDARARRRSTLRRRTVRRQRVRRRSVRRRGYASWRAPQWSYNVPNRMPRYNVSVGPRGCDRRHGDVERPTAGEGLVGVRPDRQPDAACRRAIDGVAVSSSTSRRSRSAAARRTTRRPAAVGGVVASAAARSCRPCRSSRRCPARSRSTATRSARGCASRARQAVKSSKKAGACGRGQSGRHADRERGREARARRGCSASTTPYYAITDDAGRFRIDELAPGTYDLDVLAAAGRDRESRRHVVVRRADRRESIGEGRRGKTTKTRSRSAR